MSARSTKGSPVESPLSRRRVYGTQRMLTRVLQLERARKHLPARRDNVNTTKRGNPTSGASGMLGR